MLIGLHRHIGKPRRQLAQHDAKFHLGQLKADAEVNTVAEAEMIARALALNVKGFPLGFNLFTQLLSS